MVQAKVSLANQSSSKIPLEGSIINSLLRANPNQKHSQQSADYYFKHPHLRKWFPIANKEETKQANNC